MPKTSLPKVLAFLLFASVPSFVVSGAKAEVTIFECDWRANLLSLPEPWEAYSRTFANGDVRLALLDVLEPAAAAVYIMVLSPPYEDWGGRNCKILGWKELGFSEVQFDALSAQYDEGRGLEFTLPVEIWGEDLETFTLYELSFTLDQRDAEIVPRVTQAN